MIKADLFREKWVATKIVSDADDYFGESEDALEDVCFNLGSL